jgi:predicted nucleic acid-binding protein
VIVVDASALIEALLQSPAAPAVEERLLQSGETIHAPHLIDIEVAHALRRLAITRQVAPARCREAFRYLSDFGLIRHPHDFLLPRIWELRDNLTAYDATYVALAEILGARLVTRDRRIAAAAGLRAQVDLVQVMDS